MLGSLKKLLDSNEWEIKRLGKIVEVINQLEPKMKALSEEELQEKASEFKKRLEDGSTLDEILPEAFACVREASIRTIKLRPFDVQLIGGIVLHQGKIAEMKTGEGKTLVATMPLYLNALRGHGCHLVTVNDYLAKRDAQWMGPIYLYLGLTVGVIQHGETLASYTLKRENSEYKFVECERREAYNCDITYGTNNEFGFDYLRENMVQDPSQMVQGELNYAIVDEVDNILVDEARTPLIISGMAEKPTDLYYKFSRIIPRLKKEEDYTLDEKANAAMLAEAGITKVEQAIGVKNLSDPENVELFHHANCALRAHTLMKKDVDYMVKDGQVVIVDEFTGRLMYGRRFSEGLHQAIEAKEGVKIEHESQTLASITFQNYFRLYKKLAGMTGTAKTEAEEFRKIYGLDVTVIPTNEPMIRKDFSDVVYKTEEAKFKAIVDEIVELHKKGQPALVGTRSIEKSEMLSEMLHKRGIVRIDWKKYPEGRIDSLTDCHFVLNAKEHENEAKIIARAGQKGVVTIATNMAGRGVDIVLGEGVKELGGLHIIGTERHEARRIDNQLRGRSGRQGDSGSSRFYVALDDELMRLFGGEKVSSIMDRFGFEESIPIEHPWVTKSIENAQKKVESHNFEIRKNVLDYDDVMEVQRDVIYGERRKILGGANLKENIIEFLEKSIESLVNTYTPEHIPEGEWDLKGLRAAFRQLVPTSSDSIKIEEIKDKKAGELKDYLFNLAQAVYNTREVELTEEVMRDIERMVMLRAIDEKWIEHLDAMDYLREGIGLRGYGQIDPLIAYKKEAYDMFQSMLASIQEEVVRYIFRVQLVQSQRSIYQPQSYGRGEEAKEEAKRPATVRVKNRVGRNDPCPCGSGKKYKRCCGR